MVQGRIADQLDLILAAATGMDTRTDVLEGNILTSGVTTIGREMATTSSSITAATQSLRMVYFTAAQSFTAASVKTYTGATAAGATPTLVRLGLYSIAANGAGTLVASVANDTTLYAASSTAYTRSFSSTVAVTKGARYALGVLVVTAATAPTLVGTPLFAGPTAGDYALAPRLTGSITGAVDLPASFVEGDISATALSGRFYGLILP